MKKVFLLGLIVIAFLAGCGGGAKDMESKLSIKITGTEGIRFSGNYSFIDTASAPKPKVVSGAIPSDYTGQGVAAICFFRKVSEKGLLKVEIIKDGKTIAESSTEVPYGLVTLNTPLPSKETFMAMILKKVFGE